MVHRIVGWTVRGSLVATMVAVLAGPALAHRVNVWAYVESGSTIKGTVGFPGGGKAKNVKVTAHADDGSPLGETQTDDQGEFTFQARFRCNHTFVVDTGDGHRSEYKLEAAELPDSLPAFSSDAATAADAPSPSPSPAPSPPQQQAPALVPVAANFEAAVEKAVSRQVMPLRREIEAYRQTVFVHDILGGIGYIVGVFGLVFYLKARAIGKRASPPR
ncbi:MAG: carboxypeptidase regulatory-like domain-containing protein [Planctomycetes bacterium]|nr:carboxypeptidase regulatory-like domain-containing protein [Planctomycetota bacterium]